MNTSDIYSKRIIESIIKSYLKQGAVPTLAQIEADFNTVVASQDLTSSNFTKDEWQVSRFESASALKFNSMSNELKDDAIVLYESLLGNGKRSSKLFEKWRIKSNQLENRLKKIESRIAKLLLVEADTSGYFQMAGDKFSSTDSIDMDRSSGLSINLNENFITIRKEASTTPERVFLNELRDDQLLFNLITRSNITSSGPVNNTLPRFAFMDSNLYWKQRVVSSANQSIVSELIVSLDESIQINSIKIELHSSQTNATTIVTPLTSTDGINYSRVNSSNIVGEAVDNIYFNFANTEVKFLKLILEKRSHDFIDKSSFVFEFGFKEIALFKNSFLTGTENSSTLISKPLSITLPDGTFSKFNKIFLSACEGVPDGTDINYYVTAGKTSGSEILWLVSSGMSTSIEDINGNDQRLWYPINPAERTTTVVPKVIDLVTLSSNRMENVGISFDREGPLFSPSETYDLVSLISEVVSTTATTVTEQRYVFGNPNQFALDTQIDSAVPFNKQEMRLWRNVGAQGIAQSDTTQKVRGIQAGWEFEAPFYSTVIEIEGTLGMKIDVGSNVINIDGVNKKGVVDSSVLSPGIHKIKVHQDYWNHVEPGLNSLTSLKEKDKLYPFNQKLLIEGYSYGATYSATEEKLYKGADRFAGILCDQISIFDLNHNGSSSNYNVFAIDNDITEAVDSISNIFILNCKTSIADFLNEVFVIEFVLTDQLFSHIALKAELSTTDSDLAPILDEYKIKLGV